MHSRILLLIPSLLASCQGIGDGLEPYYEGGVEPEIAGLSVDSEGGNIGGATLTIEGSGFGSDPAAISVVFGSQNARVVAASDTSIDVIVPQGPIEGGPVDIVVGTSGGQVRFEDAYNYHIADELTEQVAYVVLTNDWFSCYGGPGTDGCESIVYVGLNGIESKASFAEFAYPNLHNMYVGYWSGSDIATDEWKIQAPGQVVNSFDIEDNITDLLLDGVGGVTFENLDVDSTEYCADISPEIPERGDCDDPSAVVYDLSLLEVCEVPTYQEFHSQVYESDWAPGTSFFRGENEDGDLDESAAVPLRMTVHGVPDSDGNAENLLEGVDLLIPEYATFYATQGIADSSGDGELWSVGVMDSCFDSDGDGSSTLDDTAFEWKWKPIQADLVGNSDAKSVRSTVRVTLTSFYLGWFGGEAYPMRATITVPDINNSFEEDGETWSSVSVPASVMYQFPTTKVDFGEQSFGLFKWGDPERNDYGYFIVTLERVTEYVVPSEELGGDVVVAYVNGDLAFFEWQNPADSDSVCADCEDNDGDGWPDTSDPDCTDGKAEDNSTFGDYTCNDGVDNDSDGDIDAEDADCSSGMDAESAECGDGIDNDGDGWEDSDDPDCSSGIFEDDATFGVYTCNDGLDNDSDGWLDSDDPACADATDDESDGFAGDTECNDGVDNDGHGDIDGDDFYCQLFGVDSSEQPGMTSECVDTTDNDGDGYVDANDPDCEYPPYNNENFTAWESSLGRADLACYNAEDDDADGVVDASDWGCWTVDGTPDGFIADEDASKNGCNDGLDNDADGNVDAADLDCVKGTTETTDDSGGGDAGGSDTGKSSGDTGKSSGDTGKSAGDTGARR
jgi:IPT/TIG domain